MREKVDPDTGYTPSEQKAKWNELFGNAKKSTKLAKATLPQSKREEAFSYFKRGKSVKVVSESMDITPANVRYYLKQYEQRTK